MVPILFHLPPFPLFSVLNFHYLPLPWFDCVCVCEEEYAFTWRQQQQQWRWNVSIQVEIVSFVHIVSASAAARLQGCCKQSIRWSGPVPAAASTVILVGRRTAECVCRVCQVNQCFGGTQLNVFTCSRRRLCTANVHSIGSMDELNCVQLATRITARLVTFNWASRLLHFNSLSISLTDWMIVLHWKNEWTNESTNESSY